MNVAAERRRLVAEIRRHRKAGGDAWLRHYLGSPYPVLGLSTPQMREILAAFVEGNRALPARSVNGLAAAMWRGRTLEEKWFAISLLARHEGVLDESSWRLLDRFVDDCVGWGMCDSIGAGPIARMVHANPARYRDLVRWSRSTNPWRRRVALYALHDDVLARELDRPFDLLERLLYDEELWVQRAVGTWLRECWKRDRARTEAFLRRHAKGLPKVVITVATERAPKSFREELRRNR